MNLNKLFNNDILSLMTLLFPLDLKKTLLIRVYIYRVMGAILLFILYIDDMLFATNNIDLIPKSKHFLYNNFKMKNIRKTSYVIRIEIS